MPAKPAHATIARQWEILKLLPPRSPGKTARQLAEMLSADGFEVSKRTVERDLNELSGIFPIVCNDKGTPFGWHWMPSTELDVPSLLLSEALSLRLIEDMLRPLLPEPMLSVLEPRFRLAKSKLESLLGSVPSASWPDKVRAVPPALPLIPPQITPGVLETVQEALLAEVQLEVEYKSIDDAASKTLVLHPLAIVQRGPVTYLVASAFEYEDKRLYAMHRIVEARPLDEPAQQVGEFNLDSYLEGGAVQFGSSGPIGLEAQITDELAGYLIETPLSEDMALMKNDEGFALTATVQDTWQLKWWLLSQADQIVVFSPNTLATELKTMLANALEKYHRSL